MEWRGQTDVSNVGSQWPTIDGPLGVYNEEAVKLAKSFYYGGFLLLPVLWFVNCFYFWPVLQHREAEPLIRRYVVKSGIGYMLFSVVLLAWALTFAFGVSSGASSNMFLTISRHVLLVLEWLFLRYIGELHHKMKTGNFQVTIIYNAEGYTIA